MPSTMEKSSDINLDTLRSAVETGNAGAMTRISEIFTERGDLEAAERWLRSAANAGDVKAMVWLGSVLSNGGSREEAEGWLRRAASLGNPAAMNRIAVLMRENGQLDEAKSWYERAIEAGSPVAIDGLAYLLFSEGIATEAEKLFRQSAEGGSRYAMSFLGLLLGDRGDLAEAEMWYQQAADKGDALAMNNLGTLLREKGDYAAAETWYERAIQAGHEPAVGNLGALQTKRESQRRLDALTFDTFGWERSVDMADFRRWDTGDASLSERFCNFAPQLGSLDPDELRSWFVTVSGHIESPTFRIEDVEVSAELRQHVPEDLPKQISLLELESFPLLPAQCVVAATRHRTRGDVHYSTGIMVLFARCFWVLLLELHEREPVGVREGAVAERLLNAPSGVDEAISEFDPYDRQWDGLVPVEDDPLTRMRLLADRLRASVDLTGDVDELEPFVTY